jgi:hypothetical protein
MGGQVTADTWLGGRQYDRVSVNLATALAEPGIKATLAHITRRVVPTPAFIRLSEPSAGRGPGALARAYLHRIGGAVIAAPRAVRDVVVARRAVRPGPPSRFGRARRIAIAVDPTSIRVGAWAWRAHRRGRDQLRRTGLTDLDLPAPAAERPKDRRAVLAVLRLRGATCLERSLVLQRFDAAAGRARVLIVGVTGPGDGFRAHAWLDGDRQGDTELREIVRVAAPARPGWSIAQAIEPPCSAPTGGRPTAGPPMRRQPLLAAPCRGLSATAGHPPSAVTAGPLWGSPSTPNQVIRGGSRTVAGSLPASMTTVSRPGFQGRRAGRRRCIRTPGTVRTSPFPRRRARRA